MKKRNRPGDLSWLAVPAFFLLVNAGHAQSTLNIHQATLMETDQATPEVSTAELRSVLAENTAIVFDARSPKEYAVSHIPGAINVSAKPGVASSLYVSDVAEIGRVLKGDKARPVVIYCNGPFCGKSKRLAAELLEAGYTNVRRYQLGIPVWRALGGVTQIEPDGVRYVFGNDRTAVFIDAREPTEFATDAVPGTRNLPRSGLRPGKDVGEVKAAKDDGRLPMEDHNTRIVVFGNSSEQARPVAEAIAQEAFHYVSFFGGSSGQFKMTLQP
ncbi:MAG: rhodanese-like domain-containing protein [Burkholderiales bacterium]